VRILEITKIAKIENHLGEIVCMNDIMIEEINRIQERRIHAISYFSHIRKVA
jgi:hypothetical protein